MAGSLSKTLVLAKFPDAYMVRLGPLKYEIRRPRTKGDPPALVNYVIVSGLVMESEQAAWASAASGITEKKAGEK